MDETMDVPRQLWEPAPTAPSSNSFLLRSCPQEGVDGNNSDDGSLKADKGSEVTFTHIAEHNSRGNH